MMNLKMIKEEMNCGLVGLFCVVLVSQFACTSSPLGDNGISSGRRKMRGEILISEPRNLDGVFVWLEEFNIGTRTDENGEFSIVLPPPSTQSESGGVTGLFTLYFYIANYYLRTAEVFINNGEFLYGKADLDPDGELLNARVLTEFLLIKTTLSPSVTFLECGGGEPDVPPCDTMLVKLTLQATKGDSVPVLFPGSPSGLGGVLLRNQDTGAVFTIEAIPGSQSQHSVGVEEQPVTRVMVFDLMTNPIPRGTYEVIPYFLIRFELIPPALKATLGRSIEQLGPEYLKIPFRREETATLVIN